MKDWSESSIDIKEFIRRAEDCCNEKNYQGATRHVINIVNEAQDWLDFLIKKTEKDFDMDGRC
jgi:hypothetical protein